MAKKYTHLCALALVQQNVFQFQVPVADFVLRSKRGKKGE